MRLVTSSYHHHLLHHDDSDLHNTVSSRHPSRRNPKRTYPWKRQSRVHPTSTLRPFMIPIMSCSFLAVRTARIIIVAVLLMWTTPIWWCGSLTSSSSAEVIVVVTAWQLLHSTPPSSFPRCHHHHPISQYSARYCEVTSTRVRGMTSFLSMTMNDS